MEAKHCNEVTVIGTVEKENIFFYGNNQKRITVSKRNSTD